MPKDYFNFNSAYGSEHDLRQAIGQLHGQNVTVLADVVLNHRCADMQDEQGQWNRYRSGFDLLNWDAQHLIKDSFGGKGHKKTDGNITNATNRVFFSDAGGSKLLYCIQVRILP